MAPFFFLSFFLPDVARLNLCLVVTMLGLGSQTKPCLRVVAIIACVTLVSMFYLFGFGQPIQFIHPPMQPVISNGEVKKNEMSIPRKELLYSFMTLNITIILNVLIPLRLKNEIAQLLQWQTADWMTRVQFGRNFFHYHHIQTSSTGQSLRGRIILAFISRVGNLYSQYFCPYIIEAE
jgi:hypothetical protein